jgi:glutathione synthase/RimK-type ligase-like ATP-grasp enzyme
VSDTNFSGLISAALRTRSKHGIGLWRQLRQVVQLRYGPSRLDPWEYYFFRVFLDRYSPEEKRRFVGWRREICLDRRANARDARTPANNKLAFHLLLDKHNLPLAKILAVYGDVDPEIPGAEILSNPGSVRTFLRHTDHYPIFVKPVRGTQGKQTSALFSIENDDLKLSSGQRAELARFMEQLDPAGKGGILFQELLRPATETEAVCGRRLTSVRIIVIMTATGPDILSAVWRVPTGANVTDNFSCGLNGNIIAGVELATGRIQRTVRGIGWENIPVDRHPDTGVVFGNLELPEWRKAQSLCLDAAMLLPGLHLQHWDIALTDRGPVILEVNVEGGMRTHQIVQECGIYDERLKECTAR